MPFIKNAGIFARKTPPPMVYPDISAGFDYVLATKTTGRTFAWGTNSSYVLGTGMFLSSFTSPVSVGGAAKTFCQIGAGRYSSYALDTNGKPWGWGFNLNNSLANSNNFSQFNTPIALSTGTTAKTFCKITGGEQGHGVAIDKNGKIWSWGRNSEGQLGNNSTVQTVTPVSLWGSKTFCEITTGQYHTNAIDKNGKAWSWGSGQNGELGDGTTQIRCTPVAVYGTKTFCKIAASTAHVSAIDKNGKVWGWGLAYNGSLGNNNIGYQAVYTPISICETTQRTFCKISVGFYYTVGIDKNGKAWGWGFNDTGQIGDNSKTCRATPVSVYGSKTFCDISAKYNTTYAVDKDGNIWGWGNDLKGQLGIKGVYDVSTPLSLNATNKTFCRVSTGNLMVIDKNGKLFGWGEGPHVGDYGTAIRTSPVCTSNQDTKTFCSVANGGYHTLGLDKTGKIWSWGYNYYGEVGHLSGGYYPQATVVGTTTFCRVGSGMYNSAGISNSGQLYTWGWAWYGLLGQNIAPDFNQRYIPTIVYGGSTKTFCQVATGAESIHMTAIDKNGKIWAWGHNGSGQLGDNTMTDKCTPVSVLTTRTFCKVSNGSNHSIGISASGRIFCWGQGSSGQLGNGSYSAVSTPFQIYGTKTFCHIAGGNGHTAAIDKNGKAWCWGNGTQGQLGNNSTNYIATPVSVYGTKTFCSIGAFSFGTFAIDKNGKLWAWGEWKAAGNTPAKLTPVRVCSF